jgi:hypothetical protein
MLKIPSDEAITWFTRHASGAGLRVVRTFDLQAARHNPADCPCPHHGTERCDCQMVVLLVYGDSGWPVSLVAHSYDGQTRFSMVDNPQQRIDPSLERAIRLAFSSENILPFGQVHWSQSS